MIFLFDFVFFIILTLKDLKGEAPILSILKVKGFECLTTNVE